MRKLAVVVAGVLAAAGGRAGAGDTAAQPSGLQAFTAHAE